MANQLSAQSSITIHRLRTGDTLYISLDADKNLYQAYMTGGGVYPDWTDPNNQPTITPKVVSSSSPVALNTTLHKWSYNGTELTFTGDATDGWKTDSTNAFKMNVNNGALKIINNLANEGNLGNDTLTYSGQAEYNGTDHQLTKSIDVVIQEATSNSYYGYVDADPSIITEFDGMKQSVLTATLYHGASVVPTSDYTVDWYKDTEKLSKGNGNTLTVTQSDIDGTQLFIAKFILNGEKDPVFTYGKSITDASDDYTVMLSATGGSGGFVAENSPVTVTATVWNVKQEKAETPSGAVWSLSILDKDTFAVLGTASTNTIQVSTTHTDREGKIRDVEVLAEVTWSE